MLPDVSDNRKYDKFLVSREDEMKIRNAVLTLAAGSAVTLTSLGGSGGVLPAAAAE